MRCKISRIQQYFFFSLCLVLFAYFPTPTLAAPFPSPLATNRIIVRFQNQTVEQKKQEIVSSISTLKKESLRLANTYVYTLNSASTLANTLSQLRQFPQVQYAEIDQVATTLDTPNDQYYSSQWALEKIQAPNAWQTTHGSEEVQIAIVDSGIYPTHPDLQSQISKRVNFTPETDTDTNGHGTHVAGIASAQTNNSIGVAGVGYNTKLMSVKVLTSGGTGYYSWIANGITWATDNGAKVINLSLGGTTPSTTLQDAITYATNKGVIVVAAAGNNYSSSPIYPAYYPNVVSVAATTNTDQKANFSSFGQWVRVAAPGASIFSTYKDTYATLSGTSMATPFVSGIVGLIAGLHSDWSATQIIDKLQSSADPISGTGSYWKYGRVNACRAVDCVVSATPTPTINPTSTPTPTSVLTPTPTTNQPTPTPTTKPTSIPTPIPATPTPSPAKPWWCAYIPTYSGCK